MQKLFVSEHAYIHVSSHNLITYCFTLFHVPQAFSSYYYVAEFMNLTKNSASIGYDKFENATTELCTKTWSEVIYVYTWVDCIFFFNL